MDIVSTVSEYEEEFRVACLNTHCCTCSIPGFFMRSQYTLLYLQHTVIGGTMNMYYDNAHIQAEIVVELRQELYGQAFDIVTSDDSYSEDEEEFIIT